MILEGKLRQDLKEALKSRNAVRCSTLRLVLARAKNAEIAQRKPLDDSAMLGIITKEVEQRRESIDAFRKGNRQDLVAKEESELTILIEYLPKQLTREEIITAARKVIEEVDAQGLGDKGKVMPKLIAQLKGKAEGREINAIVSELLTTQGL